MIFIIDFKISIEKKSSWIWLNKTDFSQLYKTIIFKLIVQCIRISVHSFEYQSFSGEIYSTQVFFCNSLYWPKIIHSHYFRSFPQGHSSCLKSAKPVLFQLRCTDKYQRQSAISNSKCIGFHHQAQACKCWHNELPIFIARQQPKATENADTASSSSQINGRWCVQRNIIQLLPFFQLAPEEQRLKEPHSFAKDGEKGQYFIQTMLSLKNDGWMQ